MHDSICLEMGLDPEAQYTDLWLTFVQWLSQRGWATLLHHPASSVDSPWFCTMSRKAERTTPNEHLFIEVTGERTERHSSHGVNHQEAVARAGLKALGYKL